MRYHSLMRIHNEFLSEKKSEKILTKISYDRNHSIEEKHPHFYEFRFALAVEKRKLNKNLCKFFFSLYNIHFLSSGIMFINEMKMNFYKIPSFNIFHIPYSSVFHFFFVIEYSPFFLTHAYGRHTLKASHHISLMDHFHHH
jgi:hypothetical protein